MKYFILSLCCVFFLNQHVWAQKNKHKIEFKPGIMIEEYTPERSGIKRDVPEGYGAEMERLWLEKSSKKSNSTNIKGASNAPSQIILNFETPPPANVKAVFEMAADTWANLLSSDVPIRITVRWRSLASGVLGSAGSSVFARNFVGSNRLNTYYPIALAEKMAHENLNGTNSDIIATFNSDYTDWHIGTESVPTARQIDLYSVVLHEMGHGLGFIGQVGLDDTNTNGGYGYPGIFDQYMVNAASANLMDTTQFKNPSTTLKTAVSNNGLFMSSPTILRNNNGEKAKLYAPTAFTSGSSIYHVDQAKYKVGDANALMTPQIAKGEITREVGPIVSGAFNDFGWYSTNIIGVEYNDSEDFTNDKVISAKVFSDTLWKESSLKLMLAVNDNILKAVSMPLKKSGTNTFSYTLPKSSANRVISYYWSAEDMAGRKVTTPAEAPVIAGTKFGSYFQFTIGVDTVKPLVVYSNPLKYIFSSQNSIALPTLLASDNIGIDTIYMEYAINGGALIKKGFTKLAGDTYSYSNSFDFPLGLLKAGDVIKYRVIVKDKAKLSNVVNLPSSGFFEFKVLALQASVKNYVQNFDSGGSADFYLKGFSLLQPAGFNSVSLNSEHPYADGLEESYDAAGGTDLFTNNDAVLLKPIIIRSDTAKIYFDEVVLVEPGEAGESFLNTDGTVNRSFYDYVIVQGSNDLGKNWYNFIFGYDSNTYSNWFSAWNSKTDKDGNSITAGNTTLIKKREIDLLSSGKFKPGDNVLIRFRLHADVGAHGWGWLIDNLNIQGPTGVNPNLILAAESGSEIKELLVSPNPSDGKIRIEMPLQGNLSDLNLKLSDMAGRTVLVQTFRVTGPLFKHELDLTQLPSGNYMLQIALGDKIVNRRIVLVK